MYQRYVWRKKMGVGYYEMLATPLHIIEKDLEMISLENTYSKPRDTGGDK